MNKSTNGYITTTSWKDDFQDNLKKCELLTVRVSHTHIHAHTHACIHSTTNVINRLDTVDINLIISPSQLDLFSFHTEIEIIKLIAIVEFVR